MDLSESQALKNVSSGMMIDKTFTFHHIFYKKNLMFDMNWQSGSESDTFLPLPASASTKICLFHIPGLSSKVRYEVCSKSIRLFFLSPTVFKQITCTKCGRPHIHSWVIVKSFKLIDETLLFLQSVFRSHVIRAWRFFAFRKILLFRCSRVIASSFFKSLVILKLKLSKRSSRCWVMWH